VISDIESLFPPSAYPERRGENGTGTRTRSEGGTRTRSECEASCLRTYQDVGEGYYSKEEHIPSAFLQAFSPKTKRLCDPGQ
jgi:hypothetical protein